MSSKIIKKLKVKNEPKMWKKEKYMFNFLGMWKNFEGMREV